MASSNSQPPEIEISADGVSPESWEAFRAWAQANDPTWRAAAEVAQSLGLDEEQTLRYLCVELLRAKLQFRQRSIEIGLKSMRF